MPSKILQSTISELAQMAARLRSSELQTALRHVTDKVGATLRGAILSVAGFLDDSVSNPELGSIFDLWGPTPLNAMRRHIADAYGVAETVPGTNGTTGLNVAAVMSLAREGESIGIGRDAHVSAPAGIVLSGARPVYIVPPFSAELGVLLPLTPAEVDRFLAARPDVRAVWLTLPTYHGLQGDIDGMIAACHDRRVVVAIDEAHGPHYRFLRSLGFPRCAEDGGADIITQSTHKVLSALNQGSVIHFNNMEVLRRYEEIQSLGMVSTSFSYLILVSIEHAVGQMISEAGEIWGKSVGLARRLRKGVATLPAVRVLNEEVIDGSRVLGLDPTRVTINVANTGFSGFQIADGILRSGGIVEMATPEVVLFLVSPGVTEVEIDATIRAMWETLKTAPPMSRSVLPLTPPPVAEQVLTPRQATMLNGRQRLPVHQAVGHVSAETIACYPPGQAIVVAGERITSEIVDYLHRAVNAGAHLKRVRDDQFRTIEVICDEAVRSKLSRGLR